jgi:hypothetical protein
MRRITHLVLLALVFLSVAWSPGQAEDAAFQYHKPGQINDAIKAIASGNKDLAQVHELGQTPGNRTLLMLELGGKDKSLPAILVVANPEGNCPIASEAALQLAGLLAGDWRDDLGSHRWFIMACANPDGHARYFGRPLYEDFRNARPFNDDNDDATDEDGPEDLNSDGYITVMRQAHPEGAWIPIEGKPLLMKKAEVGKGETGQYRLFPEGIDNDSDGRINEDAPGGVNPGHNFPHGFEHYTDTDGRWAASEIESRALLAFAFDHREIAMVLTFGRTNSLKAVPEGGKKAQSSQNKYKVPERWARRMGLDPDEEYDIKFLLEMARDATGYAELSEDMLLQWLGAGAAVNPHQSDVAYWTEITERYNDFIKEAELDAKRLAPPDFPAGSIEEWAYFQYGVPSFAMDFWTLPEPAKEEKKDTGGISADEVEKMTEQEFLDLGKEKIEEFLKTSGAPAQFSADMVMGALKGGMMTTKKMAEFMRKQEKKKEAGGADEIDEALMAFDSTAIIAWQPYDHPTLGPVEIGGKRPYAALTPPASEVPTLLTKQLPFVRDLAGLLPEVAIEKVTTKRLSAGIWQVEAWVTNKGFLPYPTHQGERCQRPAPVAVTLEGGNITFLDGLARQVAGLLPGSGGNSKITWLIKAADGSSVTVKAFSFSAGAAEKNVTLEGGNR